MICLTDCTLHVTAHRLVVAGSGCGELIMAKCGGLIVAELVASRGRVVLKMLAQSRGLLVSVAVGRWWVAWSR